MASPKGRSGKFAVALTLIKNWRKQNALKRSNVSAKQRYRLHCDKSHFSVVYGANAHSDVLRVFYRHATHFGGVCAERVVALYR